MKQFLKYFSLLFAAIISGGGEVCYADNKKVTTFVSTYSNLNDYCAVFQVNSLASMGFHQAQFGVTPFVFYMLQGKSEVFNEDCMDGMARYPDKHFELAIVDPPYGIIASNGRSMKELVLHDKYGNKKWFNEKPTEEYFKELFRVSKNQIIWGGNYFNLPTPYRCAIVWDKMDYNSDFAAGELAWASFDKPLKIFKYARHAGGDDRIHPTQKPIKLYKWLLHNYAKEGDKILDTHLGSGSSRIAAYDMKFDFTAFELDKGYYEQQEKRFKNFISQGTLF